MDTDQGPFDLIESESGLLGFTLIPWKQDRGWGYSVGGILLKGAAPNSSPRYRVALTCNQYECGRRFGKGTYPALDPEDAAEVAPYKDEVRAFTRLGAYCYVDQRLLP
jgi:hypothetical protein